MFRNKISAKPLSVPCRTCMYALRSIDYQIDPEQKATISEISEGLRTEILFIHINKTLWSLHFGVLVVDELINCKCQGIIRNEIL